MTVQQRLRQLVSPQEAALPALCVHRGEKHDPAGVGSEKISTRPAIGPTFEPQIVKKRQRRLGEVDEVVLSLTRRA